MVEVLPLDLTWYELQLKDNSGKGVRERESITSILIPSLANSIADPQCLRGSLRPSCNLALRQPPWTDPVEAVLRRRRGMLAVLRQRERDRGSAAGILLLRIYT